MILDKLKDFRIQVKSNQIAYLASREQNCIERGEIEKAAAFAKIKEQKNVELRKLMGVDENEISG